MKNTIAVVFMAALLLFLAFVALAGTLTHPLGAVAFVLFVALIFAVASFKKARL